MSEIFETIQIMRKNLGPVTAYKYAVQQGYTGTEQEFAALMASYATVAEEAESARDDAIDAKTAAEEAQAAAEAAQQAAEAVGDGIDALPYIKDVVSGENLINSAIIRNKTTNAITNNNDGTYTIGTTDYGNVIFGQDDPYVLPAGDYFLFGVPDGFSFLSTTTSHNDAFVKNTTSEPMLITLAEETSCYVGFRNTARPSQAFIIAPFVKTKGLDVIVPDIEEKISTVYSKSVSNLEAKETGKYLTSGGVNAWEPYSYSTAIPVTKGDDITIKVNVSPSVSAIFYCSADLSNRKSIVTGATYDVETYHFIADRTGYIVCNFISADIHTIEIVSDKIKRFESANPLYGKTVVWCGDSIMRGNTFNDKLSGWAGRCASQLSFEFMNYGVGGSTITNNVPNGATPTIYSQIETAHAEYPDADYIIFDGGCNDADLIGTATGETKPAKFGSFDENDFSGEYDTDTFCGAFETICMHLSQYWLGKHVGYIIPHKMGVSNNYHAGVNNYRTYYETAIQICAKWGIPVLNLWDGCYMNPKHTWMCDTNNTMTSEEIYSAGFLYADRQHLTSAGYDFESPIVAEWMKGL